MRNINLEVADEVNRLKDEYIELRKKWRESIKNVHGLDEYDATMPLFNEYIESYKRWRRFQFENGQDFFFEEE